VILGSGALIQSVDRAGLIDEYLLTIHPLVLGEGRRLFPAGCPHAKLTPTRATPTTTRRHRRHLPAGAALSRSIDVSCAAGRRAGHRL
jgi:dihydrofolate reductase